MGEQISPTPPRGFEIRHDVKHDVVLTTDSNLRAKAEQVFELAKSGLLEDWQALRSNMRTANYVYVDDVQNPQFLAKVKTYDEYKARLAREKNKPKADRMFSLINEFTSAPLVSKFLELPEVKALVKRYGFNDIFLIPPLVGFIDHKEKQKTVLYEYIAGELAWATEANWKTMSNFVEDLRPIFFQQGINPGDLKERHFILRKIPDGKTNLYLFDIELYHRDLSLVKDAQ